MDVKVMDLMIGDWIHNNYTNDNYQVWPSFFSQATDFGKRMDVTLKDGNCEPIPLTDKILKANGFQYYHKNYASLTPDHPFRLEMIEWPDENGKGGLWVVGGIIKIRYIHELQNALKVCEIDKEIKLED